jgi:ketosteroid isomerase-like protein
MSHPNLALVQSVYAAFAAGDRDRVVAAFDPDVRWHNSGSDPTSGTLVGVDAVMDYLMGENHMDEYQLDVTDMLASDERVAVVARTSGRRGDRRIVNDFVQLLRVREGRVVEVHNYTWDQRAVAEFMAIPA